ncbi:MAG TPA: DUF4231 domain-containing protein [Thermoleophilaceae bacterium]
MDSKLQAAPARPDGSPKHTKSPAWYRLEDQIKWYGHKSAYSQQRYKAIKVGQIVVAALVPVLAAVGGAPRWTLGALGAIVVILEGFQQLFQYQQNWIAYRSTCESLKHEKYLFVADAGPYARARNKDALLAERVEGLVSRETARWTSGQEEAVKHDQQPEAQ